MKIEVIATETRSDRAKEPVSVKSPTIGNAENPRGFGRAFGSGFRAGVSRT